MNVNKYYFWCVFAFIIPIITYIIYPGVNVFPNIVKSIIIIVVFYKLYKNNSTIFVNLKVLKYFKYAIIIGLLHALLTMTFNKPSMSLLISETLSWSIILIIYMVKDIESIIQFSKAYLIILVPCAIFSGIYWKGFFTYDVPHIITPLALFVIISPYFSKCKQIIFLCILIGSAIYDYSVRSCLLTTIIAVTIYLVYILIPRYLIPFILSFIHKVFFITPIIFLFLGLSGKFNIFESMENQDVSFIELSHGRKSEGHLMNTDSRTSVYIDVINATENISDIILGHGSIINLKSSWMDNRHSVEAGILNIYLRYGLIGCLFFFLILSRATKLGLKYTNNNLTRLVSVYIAYKFTYMFIEDPNLDGTLILAIGICLSPIIRNMTDIEIKKILSN